MGRSEPAAAGEHYHAPVMAQEIADLLVTDPAGLYLDATLGGGGHARLILDRLGPDGGLVALDRDMEAVARGLQTFAEDRRVRVERSEFARLRDHVAPGSLAGALFDLGVSSRQLDVKAKGFSFAPGTALDMRMGAEGPTAADLLAAWDEWELASVLRRNADIDEAKRLSRAIKALVEAGRPMTSDLLREAVEKLPGLRPQDRNGMLARVFQAIRMEVNGEVDQIEAGLRAAVEALRPGGRLAVLSYHSVEDRAVKETAAAFEKACVCPAAQPVCTCGSANRRLAKVFRKPALPTPEEMARNPRSRSAKLRVLEKVAPGSAPKGPSAWTGEAR
jgi:16S rRNA (cytosine1402-N4)-methyltransferase